MQTVELQQPKNSAFFLLKKGWRDCEKSRIFAVVKHWLHRIAGVLAFLVILLVVSPLSAHNVRDTLGIGRRILFSENKGQWEDRVLFRSQMGSATLFVERDCFTIVVEEADAANKRHPWPKANGGKSSNNGEHYRSHSYRLHFEGAATEAVEGLNREEGYENYYIGRDRRRWATGVGVYGEVLYRSIFEGIDMKVYAAEGAMKYDFIVAAGADPGRIAMRYEGVDGLKLREGNLIVATSVADIVELRPYAYQIKEGDLVEVAARYTLKDNHVGIEVGDYDKSMPLIIDPYLHFSSYTGSTADNWGTTGCFDSEKNTYTSGVVFGTRASADDLDRNWQRLILTNAMERPHLGVLTGSPLTDVRVTLLGGRAHSKHTEGGDFRQATYRAVRQALMGARSVLLEPWYRFSLELPQDQLGRGMSDLQRMGASFGAPAMCGGFAALEGRVPASECQEYAIQVSAYSSGRGHFSLAFDGYDECHDADRVVEEASYDPEADLPNTPDSVFCAHGAGYTVKWRDVPEHAHVQIDPARLRPWRAADAAFFSSGA